MPNMQSLISGLHYVTAIASDPRRNLDFYTGLLGLRLVKRTINFDDPGNDLERVRYQIGFEISKRRKYDKQE